MSEGAATDQTRDEAWLQSRNCPHCSGSGQAIVFDPKYDGRRVVERECLVRGEVKVMLFAMTIVGHCLCPMGRWMRSKSDRESLLRTPDLLDTLAGRSRWQAQDPTGDVPGHAFRGGVRGAVRELGESMKVR